MLQVCKSLGFKTEELPHGETVALAPGIEIVCGPQDLLDSWMAVMADGKTFLNMNDCVFTEQKDLIAVKDCVGSVDVLASQFSYANWVGNPDDEASINDTPSTNVVKCAVRSGFFSRSGSSHVLLLSIFRMWRTST